MTEQVKLNKDGTPRKERVKLPELEMPAEMSLVPAAVMADRRPQHAAKERSKAQLAVDKLVSQAHEKWVKAGKPAAFAESNGGHVKVSEGQLVQVTRALHNSGKLLDLKVRLGKTVIEDGYADVVFVATDRPVKDDDSE